MGRKQREKGQRVTPGNYVEGGGGGAGSLSLLLAHLGLWGISVKLHLGLDTVETSKPQYLPPAQLSLRMVDLFLILSQVLVRDLVSARAMAGLLQAL